MENPGVRGGDFLEACALVSRKWGWDGNEFNIENKSKDAGMIRGSKRQGAWEREKQQNRYLRELAGLVFVVAFIHPWHSEKSNSR